MMKSKHPLVIAPAILEKLWMPFLKCGRRIFLIHHRFISASFLPTSLWKYYIRVADTSFSFAHLEMKSLHWPGVRDIFFSSSLVKSSTSCMNMRSRLSPSIFTRVTYSRNYLHNFAKLIPLLNLSSRRSLKIISDFNPDLGIVLVFTASVSVTLVFPGRSAFLTSVSRSSKRNVQAVRIFSLLQFHDVLRKLVELGDGIFFCWSSFCIFHLLLTFLQFLTSFGLQLEFRFGHDIINKCLTVCKICDYNLKLTVSQLRSARNRANND